MFPFAIPPALRDYIEFVKSWATRIQPLPGAIHLPVDLATVDDMEDAAIETYALLTHGRG